MLIGFGLRINELGTESLSEDELNKLQTVEEYRSNGLSGKNGEHPFLMKGMQTVSIIAAEKLNGFTSDPHYKISDEAALRFPVALIGSFTALLIFLIVSELFGKSIGLISAVLWAIEPMAIGFDRVAKEDSLVLFFFLLTNLFWIRGQSAAERGEKNWRWYAWATAAGFAALMASKYYPHLIGIIGAYYIIFQQIPNRKWDMGKINWLKFFIVMGMGFLIFNPTILIPETWREMLKFSSENRIGHASYEFTGGVYRNQFTAWSSGLPWTFYYVFIGVKTSLLTLFLFLVGVPLAFKRNLGDGRFFLYFWVLLIFLPFTVIGGKFTRYFTVDAPIVLIAAAIGFFYLVKWLSEKVPKQAAASLQVLALAVFVGFPLYNSLSAAPHFRLFTNSLGTQFRPTGSYFPHDEFYDTSTREIVAAIAPLARPQASVACETPTLFEYYARKIGRDDLVFISLSDKGKVSRLVDGDFIAVANGRRYFSNAEYLEFLGEFVTPTTETEIEGIISSKIYRLDPASLAGVKNIAAN